MVASRILSARLGYAAPPTADWKLFVFKLRSDGLMLIQAQGNLAEYLPPFLILLSLTETNKILSPFFLHVVGTAFTAARVGHASQLSFPDSVPKKAREFGFLSTAGLLFILGGLNAGFYLTSA